MREAELAAMRTLFETRLQQRQQLLEDLKPKQSKEQ
jgi:hypothetical protein